MSDTTTSPFDAAIETLRDRERQLDADAQSLITRRDEVREMIALLTSRKPRVPRKPRAVSEGAAEVADPSPALERPSPFRFVPAIVEPPADEAARAP